MNGHSNRFTAAPIAKVVIVGVVIVACWVPSARASHALCGFPGVFCKPGEFCNSPDGICDNRDPASECLPLPGLCTGEFDPVCACDGLTYASQCTANLEGISIRHLGDCAPDRYVVVQVRADRPGPYVPGENLLVEVWLRSDALDAVLIELVRLDFSRSDSALLLDPQFVFDFSAIPKDIGAYVVAPELPLPQAEHQVDDASADTFLTLRALDALHIGSIGVMLPARPGTFHLDPLNAEGAGETGGARMTVVILPDRTVVEDWQASDGSIVGGLFAFTIPGPSIPVASTWAMVLLSLVMLTIGTIALRKRKGSPFGTSVWLLVALLLPAAYCFAESGVIAKVVDRMLDSDHHPQRLLVRFWPGASNVERAALHSQAGAVEVKRYRSVQGLTLVTIPGGDLRDALITYLSAAEVQYAEPDYQLFPGTIPNDPHFPNLWGLHNTGQTVAGDPGTPDADIDAPEAWGIWTGDPRFRIAVIDTGINFCHPDLKDNIWWNPREQPGDANGDGCPGLCGVDDDGDGLVDECPDPLPPGASCAWDDDENGWVDDIHGFDFADNNSDPIDINRHGSQVAGIIGAMGDNLVGVAGVSWKCQIVPLKVFTDAGFGSVSYAIEAVEYVIENGIRLSNNSYGTPDFSQAFYDTIEASQSVGHLFITIAHNCPPFCTSLDNDVVPIYPGSFTQGQRTLNPL